MACIKLNFPRNKYTGIFLSRLHQKRTKHVSKKDMILRFYSRKLQIIIEMAYGIEIAAHLFLIQKIAPC